jgi:hypothetical protein
MRVHDLLFVLVWALCCYVVFSNSMCSTPIDNPCPRFPVSSFIAAPTNLFSENGLLSLSLTFRNRIGNQSSDLYCFMMDNNIDQSPTIRLKHNDRFLLTLTNCFPGNAHIQPVMNESIPLNQQACSNRQMTSSSTNLHFHGSTIPAYCHEDLIVNTFVNFQDVYSINFTVPERQSPGLYW